MLLLLRDEEEEVGIRKRKKQDCVHTGFYIVYCSLCASFISLRMHLHLFYIDPFLSRILPFLSLRIGKCHDILK